MLYHCRMWCYAIGVEAVVLRSWCVILCTVCQLVSNFLLYFYRNVHICTTDKNSVRNLRSVQNLPISEFINLNTRWHFGTSFPPGMLSVT